MPNPEQELYNKIFTNEKPLSPTEEAVYAWYLKNPQLISERKEKQNFGDIKKFIPVYGRKEIEKDIKKILQWRYKGTRKDHSQRGEMLETIMTAQAELNGWYGDMLITKTLEYDDYENHTDSVLSGKLKNGEDVFLAIDWTVTNDKNLINKKLERIKQEINHNRLTEIKYFQSPEDDDDQRGLKNIPRVILAMNYENFQALCEQTIKVIERQPKANQNFARFKLQLEILQDIREQLAQQLELANMNQTNSRKDFSAIIATIKNTLEKIDEIYLERKKYIQNEKARQTT